MSTSGNGQNRAATSSVLPSGSALSSRASKRVAVRPAAGACVCHRFVQPVYRLRPNRAPRWPDRIRQGMPAERIYQEVTQLVPKVQASFLLDTLEFMHAGGRCSSITRLGANVLHIKPCIQVHTDDHGSMGVGEMHRGKLVRCLKRLYVRGCARKAGGHRYQPRIHHPFRHRPGHHRYGAPNHPAAGGF